MAQDGYAANVEGLAQFSRALARIGADDMKQEVKQANFDIADKLADAAKTKAAGVNRQARSAAQSLRATKTQNYAAIRMGSARKPYALGAEFGTLKKTERGNYIAGFGRWRGNQWGGWSGGPGYFLHPAIRAKAPELLDEYMNKIESLMQEAFPE
jgi:septal ring factor EnvC (AmiA/AmiB activator)